MAFDADRFLARFADAYNGRDPEALREFFALDDPRFAVFEDFSDELLDAEAYGAVLEGVFDATGEMSFELLRADRFGEFVVIHGVQEITDEDEETAEPFEARLRATLWVAVSGDAGRIVSAHFSAVPDGETDILLEGTG